MLLNYLSGDNEVIRKSFRHFTTNIASGYRFKIAEQEIVTSETIEDSLFDSTISFPSSFSILIARFFSVSKS